MDEVNYNETIILPYLEKKCRDLLGNNLVLEAKLLAEMEKTKWLQNKIATLESKIDTVNKKDGAKQDALDGETY